MTAVNYGLTIEAGASFSATWQYETAGVPIDLTGWSVQLVFRTRETLPVLTVIPPNVTVGGTNGLVTLVMTPAQTSALPYKPYSALLPTVPTCHYTLSVTNTITGQVIYLSTGAVVVNGP